MNVLSNISNVYGCPRCQQISRDKSNIEKCIKRHEKNDIIKQEDDKIKKFIEENYKNVFYKNWKKNNKDNLSILSSTVSALEKAFNSFGFTISISRINVDFMLSNEKKLCLDCDINIFRVRKNFNLNKSLKASNINKKLFNIYLNKNFSYYERELILGGTAAQPSDVFSFLKIEKIKKGAFKYSIFLDISRKKYIYSALKELIELNRLSRLKLEEKNRIFEEYSKYRVPALEISDLKYMALKCEEEDLRSSIDVLNSRLITVQENKSKRMKKLLAEDSVNIPDVDASFDFDIDRQEYLHKKFSEL